MTHLLSEITIKNYKSIISETFELSNYTPLIGYNNAGKSNILSALEWLLRKSVLQNDAFNEPSEPIIITGTIKGISEDLLSQLPDNHRTSISPYIHNEELKIRRIQNTPGCRATEIKLYVLGITLQLKMTGHQILLVLIML